MKKDLMKRIEIEQVENGYIFTVNSWEKPKENYANYPVPCSPNNYKRFVCADEVDVKALLAEQL